MHPNKTVVSRQARSTGRAKMLVLAILGLLLLNPPILEIFSSNEGRTIFGWPLHVIYLYSVWGGLILMAAWPNKKQRRFDQNEVVKGSTDEI